MNDLLLLNDKTTLVSASADDKIHLWDLTTDKVIRTLTGHNRGVLCLILLNDKTTLVSGCEESKIKFWNITTGELIRTLVHDSDDDYCASVTCFQMLNDNQSLISGSWDETIKVWNTKNGELIKSIEGHCPINCLLLLNQNKLACATQANRINLVNI